jgi:inner membrane protein
MLIGATAGAFASTKLGAPLGIGLAFGSVAGLLPDVDHPGSTLGKRLPRAYHALTPGHRGPTHTVEWCALAGWFIGWLAHLCGVPGAWADVFGWCVFAGACSHLLADLLTEQGIPGSIILVTLYNLGAAPSWARRGRIRLPRWLAIRTGGWAEPMVAWVTVLAGVITIGNWWAIISAWLFSAWTAGARSG